MSRENRVTFERTKSSAMGTILNEIVTLDDGDMGLRFTFTLDVDGLADGSREETAERMSRSIFRAWAAPWQRSGGGWNPAR